LKNYCMTDDQLSADGDGSCHLDQRAAIKPDRPSAAIDTDRAHRMSIDGGEGRPERSS
jgi:hypothetical protein